MFTDYSNRAKLKKKKGRRQNLLSVFLHLEAATAKPEAFLTTHRPAQTKTSALSPAGKGTFLLSLPAHQTHGLCASVCTFKREKSKPECPRSHPSYAELARLKSSR